VSFNDIDQQQVGDCFLLGSLAAVARQDPQRIRNMVVDNGNGTYTVTFKEQRSVGAGLGTHLEWFDVPITVAADFPGGLAGDKHAAPGDTGWGTIEIWPLVIEKAYGQYLTCMDPYGAITKGGSPRTALEMLTGRPVTSDGSLSVGLGGPESFDTLLADFQAGRAITVGTDAKEGTLVKDHCYAVSNVYRDANGKQWVELYNPWAHDHATLSFDEGCANARSTPRERDGRRRRTRCATQPTACGRNSEFAANPGSSPSARLRRSPTVVVGESRERSMSGEALIDTRTGRLLQVLSAGRRRAP